MASSREASFNVERAVDVAWTSSFDFSPVLSFSFRASVEGVPALLNKQTIVCSHNMLGESSNIHM